MTVVTIAAADIVSLGGSLPLSGFIDVWRLTPVAGGMDKSKVGSQRVADGSLNLDSAPAGGAILLVPRGVGGLNQPWAVIPPSGEISLVNLIAHHSVNPGTVEPTPDEQASWALVLEQIRVISLTTADDAATTTQKAATAATAATTATGAASAASGSASAAATAAGSAGTAASTATTKAADAEVARAAAVQAKTAAEAVGTTTDTVLKAIDANPASQTRVQQDARQGVTFLNRTGAATRLRDAGDGLPTAAVDVRHRAPAGYIFHAVSEAGSGGFLQAYGTDEGSAGAVLRSHKNGSASEHAIQHGGASMLNYWQGYSNSSLLTGEVFKGNQGIKLVSKSGQGFGDGVTTVGSTTFTSALAGFTAGDVGKSISQTTTRGSTAPSGSIPAGTTIIAVASATSVTLSNPAASNAVTLPFLVAGRAPDATQPLLSFYDDNGSTLLAQIRRSGVDFFTADNPGTAAFSITSSGVMAARFGSSLSNVLASGSNGVTIANYQPAMHTVFIKGVAAQTGDQIHIEDSTGAIQSRINKAGYIMTRKNTPPLVGDMANNEGTIHFDGTAGAEKWYLSIRNSAGALITKQVQVL
ncbi:MULTISPECIES: hypothetical protein [unclassified Cryobacterium]|uniref:hypothetical protein n=1 Tax=unclassified Cryobacterium TaxID=2649013 RepID=UPI0010693EAA|nr:MULTISPECIES: hypothetical protein [unclassified Cryobacterium]TFC59394.1 hypothetical protein E3O68_00400 [Cryobacterium sp. TMB3-1-2]TFC67190.1 hypothetical protein E3T21_17095 [Cryobacterium sp. TMB3-15]TFC73297.1 hypothetical protein E3T22_16960 [Cryobacterium sp. TMB3-10]TFD46185.1 hypothetical protein E3T58_01595 [Cryobacterium sp. TMB3-12]